MDIWISTYIYMDIYIYVYIDVLRDIHVKHLDIYMWISRSRCGYLHRYPQGYPCATFRYLHVDFKLGYLHAINHSSAASHRSIARRAKIAAIFVKVFVIDDDNLSSSPAGGANMGPGAPPAPAQERRSPTIGAALLPTDSGPAPTRLLSYNAVTVGRAQTRPCRGATTEGVPSRKSMSVAYRREYRDKKAYSSFRSTGRGNGATGVHRASSDGYQGASIKHSLIYARESPSSILKWTPQREAGKELFKLHRTWLRPQDRAIGPAVQYTVCHCLWSLSGSLSRAG